VRAEVEGHPPVFVRDCHADLYAAISLAAARTGRAVLRTVQRHERVDRTRGELPHAETESFSITEGGVS